MDFNVLKTHQLHRRFQFILLHAEYLNNAGLTAGSKAPPNRLINENCSSRSAIALKVENIIIKSNPTIQVYFTSPIYCFYHFLKYIYCCRQAIHMPTTMIRNNYSVNSYFTAISAISAVNITLRTIGSLMDFCQAIPDHIEFFDPEENKRTHQHANRLQRQYFFLH